MPNCPRCGAELQYVQRWNNNNYTPEYTACEVNFAPDRFYRESFVEVEPGKFVSVFRHHCPKEQPAVHEKYRPKNLAFKGDRTKFPKRPKKQKDPDLFE